MVLFVEQLVLIQLLPADAATGVQVCTGKFAVPMVVVAQVVVTKELPAVGPLAVHEATNVGPVVFVVQLMVPPGVQTRTAVESSVAASY